VVLIGDAAHASSPMMGQGGCLAMEDAYVLAEVLRSAASVERALESYVSRRKARVSWVQQASRAVAESFGLPPLPAPEQAMKKPHRSHYQVRIHRMGHISEGYGAFASALMK
jgi:2-polyprenyl-6-methoxyphenol hydroxylase-like FAD-dependent oxidoreductase